MNLYLAFVLGGGQKYGFCRGRVETPQKENLIPKKDLESQFEGGTSSHSLEFNTIYCILQTQKHITKQ